MFKKFIMSLVLFAGISTPLFASQSIYLTMSSNNIDFSFEPNHSKVFTNAFPWTLKATCQISCDDSVRNSMEAKIIRKGGIMNDTVLNVGDSMRLDIHNGDIFTMISYTGSKVEIKNTGEKVIIASCYVVN